jgi:hypothetical protein
MTKAAELAKMGEVLTNSQIGGRRNIIINGAMQVAQRGTSTASVTTAGYHSCDRWNLTMSGRDEAVFTVSQNSSNILDGFSNSFKIETTTAESAIASDEFFIARQKIEAQNLQQLAYGTSSAEKITLSFYVKSSVTATFAIYLYKADTTARVIGSTYTINSANTWEKKTITFVGDTDSSATIANDNGDGLNVGFVLGAGSAFTGTSNTSWADYANGRLADGHAGNAVVTTTNATWEITGVQLEVGSQATPFEHRSFGEELALCERYFQKHFGTTDANLYTAYALMRWSTNTGFITIQLREMMRAEPSASVVAKDGSTLSVFAGHCEGNGNSDDFTAGNMTLVQGHDATATFTIGLDFNPSTDHAHVAYLGQHTRIDFDAEL